MAFDSIRDSSWEIKQNGIKNLQLFKVVAKWRHIRQLIAITSWKTRVYELIKYEEALKIEKNYHTVKNGEFLRDGRKQNVVKSKISVYLRKLMKASFIALFDNRCKL